MIAANTCSVYRLRGLGIDKRYKDIFVHTYARMLRVPEGGKEPDFRNVSVVQVILSREGHTSVESIRDYKVMTVLLRIEARRKLSGHIDQHIGYCYPALLLVGAGVI